MGLPSCVFDQADRELLRVVPRSLDIFFSLAFVFLADVLVWLRSSGLKTTGHFNLLESPTPFDSCREEFVTHEGLHAEIRALGGQSWRE